MTFNESDEALHTPDPDVARWQENYYFILWDTVQQNGLIYHLQRVPWLGWQEAQVAVGVGGVFASASFRRPFDLAAPVPDVEMELVSAFRQWRIALDTHGTVGSSPSGFLFTRPGGDVRMAADVTLSSELPVVDFNEALAALFGSSGAAEPDLANEVSHHYEQGGTWSGSLSVGDRTVSGSGLFIRDHSWGKRDDPAGFSAFWLASCLDDGQLYCNTIGFPAGDGWQGVGLLTDRDGTRFTTEVAASFWPTPGLASYDRAEYRLGAGIEQTVRTYTQLHVPTYFPHSGPRRFDNNALSIVEMGGRHGFGSAMFASVLDAAAAVQLDIYDFDSPALDVPLR